MKDQRRSRISNAIAPDDTDLIGPKKPQSFSRYDNIGLAVPPADITELAAVDTSHLIDCLETLWAY